MRAWSSRSWPKIWTASAPESKHCARAGASLEAIYIQVLAPTASHLRQLWSDDLCGFAEVTLALWRLQQLLREYSVAFQGESEQHVTGHRALLAPAPREKPDLSFVMFGLVMMSQFLRRDGWEAWIEPNPSSPEFAEVVRSQWFDVVEFLVSGDKQLDALAAGHSNDPAGVAESIRWSHGLRSGFHRTSRTGPAGGSRSDGNRCEAGSAQGRRAGSPDGKSLPGALTNKKRSLGMKAGVVMSFALEASGSREGVQSPKGTDWAISMPRLSRH